MALSEPTSTVVNGHHHHDDIQQPNNDQLTFDEVALIEQKYRLPIRDLYRLAVRFYRERESSDLVVTYQNRLKFLAYSKQASHGKYSENGPDSDAGWFDVIGNDRRHYWEELGDLSKEGAMAGFVSLLDRVCPPFREFVDSHVLNDMARREQDEAEERRRCDQHHRSGNRQEETVFDQERFEIQRRHIQKALNQQTYHQFRAYAEQQFPGNPDQQECLIRQLQEQHYQQYMSQVYAQQALNDEKLAAAAADGENDGLAQCHQTIDRRDSSDASDDDVPGDDLPSNPAISPASMWTRKDTIDFKNAIKKEGSDGVIKVGHGETVTVRVPTHEEGTCLFWEFATDSYDIGFGVYFEWTIAESNQVSVHIESSDDEGEEELGAGVGAKGGDVESGSPTKDKSNDPNKPHMDEIIPVYRRDCHEEVYAGSHVYPGRGVYLLKFDNSYSLWRSKTLYYRVYYSK